ncbi:OLC1v1007934C1 [Oldenlandia corymbosa var. corymbosa]|uniref:OLC1v1007934C1 n=1 Tax=Oldenlandia corymbosa var. corymbosa TaxID=529605 RepID=A0AAV1DLW8_OLDCO|nr:OLC1v1007934C1 [Oldenlandia corymbosa var. corymbosa]
MVSLTPIFFTKTLVIIWLWGGLVSGSPNTQVFQEECSQAFYPAIDPYGISVTYILNDVMKNTPNSQPYDYSVSGLPPVNAYGFGSCAPALSNSDCSTCMTAAYTEIVNRCGGHISGKVLLKDCSIGYMKDVAHK